MNTQKNDEDYKKFQELTKDVVFHPFNKDVMLERRRINKSDEEPSSDILIELDDFVVSRLNEIVEEEGVTISEFLNDALYNMMIQLINKDSSSGLEIIDSVYMSHNIYELINTGKDYCVVDTFSKQKAVLMTNKNTIDLYNQISNITEENIDEN